MTVGINVADLSEDSKTWRDFLECRLPVLPGFAEIGRIAELADSIKQGAFPSSGTNLPPGSVAVVANIYAGFFGGPLSQLLKCLAAVKIRAEFEKNGVAAAAVCLVRYGARPGFSPWESVLIDRSSKLHFLKSTAGDNETPSPANADIRDENFLREIFPGGDIESLSALKEAFLPGANLVSSCALWFEYMLKDFGAIVMEADAVSTGYNLSGAESQGLRQGRELPVAAFVADSSEIAEYVDAPPLRDGAGLVRPLVWPCPDATISNARSLKTLKRYGLDFERVFEGKERVIEYVRGTLKSDVPARLQKLRDEAGAVLDELEAAVFAARGDRSKRIRKARAARIIYQLEKIQRLSRAALSDKEKAAANRICKACDFLAPLGRRQKDALSVAQIPVSFGRAGLRALYEHLDITTSDHQLIEIN